MAETKGPVSQECQSPLITKALDRYRAELNDGGDAILEVDNLEDLLNQARSFEPKGSRVPKQSTPFDRLEPILSCFNDFAAVMAVCFGAQPKITGILASPSKDILNDILDMLEEISSSLPRFTTYEKTLPIDDAFESALIEAYTEIICFCARAINFFRAHPHHPLVQKAWPQFRNDFHKTIKRLRRRTQIVEAEAEAARMRVDNEKHAELLSLMKAFKANNIHDNVLPCYHIPYGINERVIGRENELNQVADALDPHKGSRQSRSLALYGMGGVGKTSIALQYVNNARKQYDAIFWISADNGVKMLQDFLEIAQKLNLVPNDRKSEDANTAMFKVKTWLNDTDCRWLIVFDNADDLDILTQAWPGSAPGSILLTSRDFTAAFSPASAGLAVQPFDDAVGSVAFLELLNQPNSTGPNLELAREITHRLGGLPLALRQIAGFIVKQRLPLSNFLSLYERNSAKIHTKKAGPSDYQHTISTVWRLSFGQLSGNSILLLKLLAFFDPDRVDEAILQSFQAPLVASGEFDFLQDEMETAPSLQLFLHECERCHEALPLARLALEAITDKSSLPYAQGIDILGVILLDTNHPKEALECFNTCLAIRQTLLSQTDPFLASALNHVSLAYTELRDFQQAALYQQQAMDIRLEINSPMIGNSYSNMSSILLGMGKPDDAEVMLLRCPSLKNMTDESFLRTDNPRFSSDMVLLSRIWISKGRYEDALRLRSKALAFRQKTFGDKYKTCDSLYQIADLLSHRGDYASAVDLLEKSLTFLKRLPESEGYIGRAYFKLSQIHTKMGSDMDTQKQCKEAAISYRSKAYTDLNPGDDYSEESFNLLVPWMLW
ncbi:hypothetical protein AJ79_06817 [Helicocarpus griseus UAMH5409]|uniref:NB-ARC domain-containing protein n=1 Tax=Helicocarpus griseus UAMH5409 TaxID=1447875 RepID=A0A2B7X9M0_9EURO|nr:hypothetical protein AJ79_06817 [Helicocarpus griseus UAMH5409]